MRFWAALRISGFVENVAFDAKYDILWGFLNVYMSQIWIMSWVHFSDFSLYEESCAFNIVAIGIC